MIPACQRSWTGSRRSDSMSMFVNTNVSALNAQRQLFNSSNSLNTSFERLSSGFRINSASDDSAGLQISDRMTSQINGLNQAVRNSSDGISVAQTAEGALNEVASSLQRIRQLAIQSQNGINSAEDREALNTETTALITEISRITSTTEFNGVALFDGNFNADFLVGAKSGQNINITIADSDATALGINATSVSTVAAAITAMDSVDGALSTINGMRADLGALQNRFESTIRNLSNISENVSSARSRIRDTDFASETANLTRSQIMQQASSTILAQANQRPQAALQLLG
jgi:flagellin